VKKDVKFKVAAKKWLDARLMAKIFNNDNSGNLMRNPVKCGERNTNSPELLLLKFLP